MVRINGEDKALAGINLLEYLKDAGYQLEKIVVERNPVSYTHLVTM